MATDREYLEGVDAYRKGLPLDISKSYAWQKGWQGCRTVEQLGPGCPSWYCEKKPEPAFEKPSYMYYAEEQINWKWGR